MIIYQDSRFNYLWLGQLSVNFLNWSLVLT